MTLVPKAPIPYPSSLVHGHVYNGEIYLFGSGSANADSSPDTKIYNPTTDTWRFGASLGGGWNRVDGVLIGSSVYTVNITRIYRFDIPANTWTNINATTTGSVGASSHVAEYGGDIYVFGPSDVRRYNISGNVWTTLASWPVNTVEGGTWSGQWASVIRDGDWAYCGGNQFNADYRSQRFVRYNFPGNFFEVLPRIPLPMQYARCAILDRRFVICGSPAPIWSYPIDDGASGQWRYEGDVATFSGYVDAAAITFGGAIYLMGGVRNGDETVNLRFTYGPPFSGNPVVGGAGGGPSLRQPNTANPPTSAQHSIRVAGRNTYH